MATIHEYVSGAVCEQLEKAFSVFAASAGPLQGTDIGALFSRNVAILAPKRLRLAEAVRWTGAAKRCAVGERVCRAVHGGTPLTEAVFLDELAAGMAAAGKARLVSREEAADTLRKYRRQPIIASKVSGKYAEICPTWPKMCLYWTMEKHRLRCIDRG